jgi:hypothetical protein
MPVILDHRVGRSAIPTEESFRSRGLAIHRPMERCEVGRDAEEGAGKQKYPG